MTATSPTAPRPSPEPRKPAGSSKLKKAIMAWARTLHTYTTLFAFLGLLLYSVSGFLLHHDTWFSGKPLQHTDNISLPAALVSEPNDKLEKVKLIELLRSQGHVSGEIEMRPPQPGEPPDDGINLDDPASITIAFRGPSRSADVTITRVADDKHKVGDTQIEFESRGLTGILGDLHQGKHTGAAWDLVIDLVACTLFFASITGLLMWTQLTKRRTVGLVCLFAGMAIMLVIYFGFVP